jgi:hypothetical protein
MAIKQNLCPRCQQWTTNASDLGFCATCFEKADDYDITKTLVNIVRYEHQVLRQAGLKRDSTKYSKWSVRLMEHTGWTMNQFVKIIVERKDIY